MEGESTKRLFLAIDIPETHREILCDLQEPLRGVRWTPSEQLHLTLRFLGDTRAEPERALILQLGQVRVEPFILPLEGIGVFPPRGLPRSIWVGAGQAHPRLFQLRQQIDDGLLACGMEVDLRTFTAHVTLGRCLRANPGAVSGFLRQHRTFEGPPFRVDRFTLYSSVRTSSGPIYQTERVFELSEAG